MAGQFVQPHGPPPYGAPGPLSPSSYAPAGHLSPRTPPSAGHPPSSLASQMQGRRDTLPPFGAPHGQSHYPPGYDGRGPFPPMQQEPYNMPRYMPGQSMPPPMIPGSVQAHKRAYRQRRKDPSCDACRERKVKCDATDTTSCSECSGRNVKCQFTKETNRRMSSIKQVQDLEKQLQAAKQQVSQLQHMVVKPDPSDDGSCSAVEETPEEGPNKRRRLTKSQDFQTVARNMENYGKELIRLPTNSRESPHWDYNIGGNLPDLPPKELADRMLTDFKTMIYTAFPMFSWSSLMQRHEELYQNGPTTKFSQSWYALYFAVLAFGSLRTCKEDGRRFFQQGSRLVDLWSCECSMDAIRATVILSMFQVESNNITSGFKTLGHAVRAAIDMGLHRKLEQRSTQEEQARLSLWWCIFSTERLLALELGRPSMIDDSDCPPFHQAIGYDLRPIDRMTSMAGSDPQFDFINQVARCTSYLQKAFKQPVIAPETLMETEEQIDKCMAGLPPFQQLKAKDYLDMVPSTPIVYIQNLRLMLHRHNLSPASSPEIRRQALTQCVAAAQDTARLMLRTLHPAPPTPSHANAHPESSEEKLRFASSAFLCTHVWRCILILACTGEYTTALHCGQASAAIGRHRNINTACGRYLEFVLNFIRSRNRTCARLPLHEDEELLAYASGDLQSNLDQAWVWQSSFRTNGEHVAVDFKVDQDELDRWHGWRDILCTLEQMAEEQKWEKERPQSRPTTQGAQQVPHITQILSPPIAAFAAEDVCRPKASTPATPSGNRMSIADLI